MPKTIEEREDVQYNADRWEEWIEEQLEAHWNGSYSFHATLPSNMPLNDLIIQELRVRYEQAGWWIWFNDTHLGVKTLATHEQEELKIHESNQNN